jgi:hypothetical protein
MILTIQTMSLSLCPSLFLNFSLSLSYTHSLTLYLSHTLSLSLSLTISLTISLSLSLSLSPSLCFSFSLSLSPGGPKSLDAGFDVFLIICLSFFIFEFVSTTIVKTREFSLYPKLVVKGYLFSFFWFMDIIFIIAIYADITSIGQVLYNEAGVYNLTIFGGSGLVGKGARLVRLIKIMQQYKVSSDLRKRRNQELCTLGLGLCSEWVVRVRVKNQLMLCILSLFPSLILSRSFSLAHSLSLSQYGCSSWSMVISMKMN